MQAKDYMPLICWRWFWCKIALSLMLDVWWLTTFDDRCGKWKAQRWHLISSLIIFCLWHLYQYRRSNAHTATFRSSHILVSENWAVWVTGMGWVETRDINSPTSTMSNWNKLSSAHICWLRPIWWNKMKRVQQQQKLQNVKLSNNNQINWREMTFNLKYLRKLLLMPFK